MISKIQILLLILLVVVIVPCSVNAVSLDNIDTVLTTGQINGNGSVVSEDNDVTAPPPPVNFNNINSTPKIKLNVDGAVVSEDNDVTTPPKNIKFDDSGYNFSSGSTPLDDDSSDVSEGCSGKYCPNNDSDDDNGSVSTKSSKKSVSGKGKVTHIHTRLNVRDGVWGNIIGHLRNGKNVDIIGEDGDWYKIKYRGRTAYVYKNYINNSNRGGSTGSSYSGGSNSSGDVSNNDSSNDSDGGSSPVVSGAGSSVYNSISNHKILSKKVFMLAYKGYKKMHPKNGRYLTIADFSKPSSRKRLYVIDLSRKKIIYYTYVAHGKNSGVLMAKRFSNRSGSKKSSLGFYKTAETYSGKHGYSLKLDGLERGFNSKARSRAIVMHGASYVSGSFVRRHGRLGRSWGCPAIPNKYKRAIISKIKGGSCLFIYAKDSNYLRHSRFLR